MKVFVWWKDKYKNISFFKKTENLYGYNSWVEADICQEVSITLKNSSYRIATKEYIYQAINYFTTTCYFLIRI